MMSEFGCLQLVLFRLFYFNVMPNKNTKKKSLLPPKAHIISHSLMHKNEHTDRQPCSHALNYYLSLHV